MLDEYDDRPDDAPTAADWVAAAGVWFVKLTAVCAVVTACALYWIWLGRAFVAAFE